jgi:hypothetical protein
MLLHRSHKHARPGSSGGRVTFSIVTLLVIGLTASTAIAARQHTHPDGKGLLRRARQLRHVSGTDGDGEYHVHVHEPGRSSGARPEPCAHHDLGRNRGTC